MTNAMTVTLKITMVARQLAWLKKNLSVSGG
jgi:hypothetical protein